MPRDEEFGPYVSAAERRRLGQRAVSARKKGGLPVEPVVVEGRVIAATFWGQAWCDHLEHYSDFANRLPRGRTYLRNGSVLHLGMAKGSVTALVQGSDLYEVAIKIAVLPAARWKTIVGACSGEIGTLVELLKGTISSGVMKIVSDRHKGLFPTSDQIDMECSCPDAAGVCKHVAAVLYGIGARLDTKPELLFVLRGVDHRDLLASASVPIAPRTATKSVKRIADADLAGVFGIEIDRGVAKPSKRAPAKRA